MAYGDTPVTDGFQSAIAAGMELATPTTLVERRVLAYVLPHGAKVHEVDFERYLDRPARKRGTYAFDDAKSFIAFVNREKTPETVIFADRESPGFKAVFNGPAANQQAVTYVDPPTPCELGAPGWGDYTATFSCPFSEEWKRWEAKDGERMSQTEFAVFIEDNMLDIIQPPMGGGVGAVNPLFPTAEEMLQVSRSLEAKNGVTFASAIKLSNGEVQFRYEEEVSGFVANGTIEVPQKFAVGIPVFAGTDPWQIVAKLRYRIERGGLTMWYDFERLFKVKERAFDEARAQIESGTGLPLYLGSKAQ